MPLSQFLLRRAQTAQVHEGRNVEDHEPEGAERERPHVEVREQADAVEEEHVRKCPWNAFHCKFEVQAHNITSRTPLW